MGWRNGTRLRELTTSSNASARDPCVHRLVQAYHGAGRRLKVQTARIRVGCGAGPHVFEPSATHKDG